MSTRKSSAQHAPDMPLNRLLGHAERQLANRLDGILAENGLTIDQWRVLDQLSDGAGLPMSEIAEAIVVPGPTLTKIIDKLVDGATVYRLVDDRDRRRVLAFISDDGRALHERLAPLVAAIEGDALSALGDNAATLIHLLSELAVARTKTGLVPLRIPAHRSA